VFGNRVASAALRAEPPIDDLGLFDHVPVVLGRGQAGTNANGAVDIGDGSTAATDHVVVVIADPCLVASDRAPRLYAPQHAGPSQDGQHVVDGLVADLWKLLTNVVDDRVGVGVGMTVHGLEHRDPWAGDPKVMATQDFVHAQSLPVFLNRSSSDCMEYARS
jgi:hypothetical protein